MGHKLDNELFYKLLKLFLGDVQVSSLSQIHSSDLILSYNALNMDIGYRALTLK